MTFVEPGLPCPPKREARRWKARRWILVILIAAVASACATAVNPVELPPVQPPAVKLPNQAESTRFAVIGDTGTGGIEQYRLAQQLIAAHSRYPFEFVLMTGDNMYGTQTPRDFVNKFEAPYKQLLDAGVKFYASLGNHDDTDQVFYKPFNMDGKRFYTFKPKADVRIYGIDSNYMSREQMEWLEKELADSTSQWKIAFFHHPPYSTGGRHGSDMQLRQALEPLFVKHGLDVVFTGHEHFYERLKPQQGVHYFISGGGGKLRRGDIAGGPIHEKGFDEGYHFMLVEIAGDVMHFQVINEVGTTVDSGAVKRPPTAADSQ